MITLNGITPSDCNDCIGGFKRAGIIDGGFIDYDAITVDANGRITALAVTLAGAGKAVEWIPDDDETARIDSTGERNGKKYRSNVEGFFKFDCLNIDSVRAAELAKSACSLVIVYEYNSGVQSVQGIDVVPDGVGYKAVPSITVARANPSAMSDTSANTDRVEILINSVSRNVLTVLADPSTFGLDEFLDL